MTRATSQFFMREHIKAPAVVLLAALLGATPALASPVPLPAQIQAYEAADDIDRVKLLIYLAKNGKEDQAEYLLQKYPLEGDFGPNRKLYIEGLILNARRDHTGAVQKFRSVLADDPSLSLVRADLAKTLVTLEENDSAIYHLKQLETEAPTAAAAKDLREFMTRIDESSPFRKSFWIAAAPSSNVNNGTTATDPRLPGFTGTKPEKAYGVSAGGHAGFSKRLGNDFSLVTGIGATATVYPGDAEYNSLALNQSLEIRRLLDNGYLGLGIVASQSAQVEERDWASYSFGPRVSLRHALNQNISISADATFEWRNYNEDYNADSDGNALLLNAAATYGFSQGFSITAGLGFDDINAVDGIKSYETLSGEFAVHKELPLGLTVDASVKLACSQFDDPLIVGFGLFGVNFGEREDWRTTAEFELTKRDLNIMGFAPTLSYTYNKNSSSIFLFDFDSHAVDLRFTKDF